MVASLCALMLSPYPQIDLRIMGINESSSHLVFQGLDELASQTLAGCTKLETGLEIEGSAFLMIAVKIKSLFHVFVSLPLSAATEYLKFETIPI